MEGGFQQEPGTRGPVSPPCLVRWRRKGENGRRTCGRPAARHGDARLREQLQDLGRVDLRIGLPVRIQPHYVLERVFRGGQIVQAQLVRKVDPEYPKIARDSGAKGAVKLTATIGVDGKVKSVKALGGHPLLVRSATDAVMQWSYKPTMLNGQAVETQTEIVLNFVNER